MGDTQQDLQNTYLAPKIKEFVEDCYNNSFKHLTNVNAEEILDTSAVEPSYRAFGGKFKLINDHYILGFTGMSAGQTNDVKIFTQRLEDLTTVGNNLYSKGYQAIMLGYYEEGFFMYTHIFKHITELSEMTDCYLATFVINQSYILNVIKEAINKLLGFSKIHYIRKPRDLESILKIY